MTAVLPGIAFEAAPRPLDVSLPRMDVAAFVGLASCGPVGMPVACEDVGRFRQVFGPDLVLGRDEATGRVAASHLGPAVEAFFAAGGRRCLVVRVARTRTTDGAARAQRAHVALPGVVDSGPGADPTSLARLTARAVGGWSQGLAVSLGVDRRPLRGRVDVKARHDGGRYAGCWVLPGANGLVVGDLLEVRGSGWSVFVPVTAVLAPSGARADDPSAVPGAPSAVLDPARARWFAHPDPPGDDATVTRLGDPDELELALDVAGGVAPASEVAGGVTTRTFGLHGDDLDLLREGDLLRVATGGQVAFAPVTRGPAGLRAGPLWRPIEEPSAEDLRTGDGTTEGAVARVTLRLRVLAGDDEVARLDGVGLEPEHPLGLPSQPVDEVRFQEPDAPPSPFPFVGAPPGAPRPLPAPGARPSPSGPSLTPLLETAPHTWTTPVPVRWDDDTTGLAREGLLPLTADVFVDDRFADAGLEVLRRLGDQHRVEGARDLGGVHALLSRRQVTLAAVPDAVHVGWLRKGIEPVAPLVAPDLRLPTRERGGLVLRWSEVGGAVGYRIEVLAADGTGAVVHGWDVPASELSATIDVAEGGEDGSAVRVRARFAGAPDVVTGPASATRLTRVLAGDFEACEEPVEALHVDIGEVEGSSVALWWDDPDLDPPADGAAATVRTYDLVRGPAVDLAGAPLRRITVTATAPPDAAVPAVTSPHADVEVERIGERTRVGVRVARDDGPGYARVRVSATPATPAGPWSRVVGIPGRARDRLTFDREAADRERRLVQRALLRVAAARGDVLAALSLPAAARAGDAAAELDRLLGEVPAHDADVLRQHAVVHHPWPVGPDLQPHPPDGAICGLLADVAIRHGAWVAPANRPLAGTLGVWSAGPDESLALATSGVNPLARTIPGVVAVTGRTLAAAGDLDRIGPRRLLMLLRRLAEREGATRTFAPDGPDLRAGLRTTFTRMLTDLYVRGALAGASPDQAFEVVVHAGHAPADPPGHVRVELRVAPAQPMEFVTVRLLSGDGGARVEVAS